MYQESVGGSVLPEDNEGFPLVAVRGLKKSFSGKSVLTDANFDITRGEVVAVIGPSGAGKSTLCRSINRLEVLDAGEIRIEGKLLPPGGAELRKLRNRLGMVFQSINLYAHMTILDNVIVGPVSVLHRAPARARAEAMALLKSVGIAQEANKYPVQLSGGQQQRAAIVRALAMNPDILLCDEPTSALDPVSTHAIQDIIASLAGKGMTLLIVTHDIGFARRCASRVIFMDEGKIVEDSPATLFFKEPKTARARAFLNEALAAPTVVFAPGERGQ